MSEGPPPPKVEDIELPALRVNGPRWHLIGPAVMIPGALLLGLANYPIIGGLLMAIGGVFSVYMSGWVDGFKWPLDKDDGRWHLTDSASHATTKGGTTLVKAVCGHVLVAVELKSAKSGISDSRSQCPVCLNLPRKRSESGFLVRGGSL